MTLPSAAALCKLSLPAVTHCQLFCPLYRRGQNNW